MGFDCVGLKPLKKAGEYFRGSSFEWPYLWEFICKNCDDILTPDQMVGGRYNDGTWIYPIDAALIALRLKIVLDSKCLTQLEQVQIQREEQNDVEALPFEEPNTCADQWLDRELRFFIEFAESSGGFVIS